MSTKKRVPRARAKRRTGTAAVAQQALTLAKKANKQELKYHEVSQGASLIGPSGLIFMNAITSLSAGTGSNQRIGNAVNPKSVKLRLSALYNPLAASAGQLYRIIIFQNLLSGSPAAVTDYLLTANFYAMKSIDNRFNTRTLYDKVFSVTNDSPQRSHLISVKIPKPIYYPGATTTPEKNGVFIIAISNEVTLLNAPTLEGTGRFFFTE